MGARAFLDIRLAGGHELGTRVRDESVESAVTRAKGILVVDDDPALRTMFARALDSLGDVSCAVNGIDAVRRLSEKTFGLILMDLHMPGLDGFTILKLLTNRTGPNRDTPVVVVSADISDSARALALERAVFAFTKPVRIVQLVDLVSSALSKRSRS